MLALSEGMESGTYREIICGDRINENINSSALL